MKVVAALLFALLPALANSQNYPVRPVRFISPYPPGGVVDIAARLVGRKVSELCGDSRSSSRTELAAAAPSRRIKSLGRRPTATRTFSRR